MKFAFAVAVAVAVAAGCASHASRGSGSAKPATPDEARAIAKEATIYGFPLVDNYRVQYSYFVDRGGSEFKAPWNEIANEARVYTPADKAIQTPNSDTPYSFVGADLRAEPLVFTVPNVNYGRYYALQFIDQYTFNFAYVGTPTSGNDAAKFLLVGPNWKGKTPAGVKGVIHSETEFAFVLYRTQLFRPDDMDQVKRIQAGYRVQTLSSYLGKPAPPAAPRIDFIKPLSPGEERNSIDFFRIMDFVLRFCPVVPSEQDVRARFARIGVGAGEPFDASKLSPEMKSAMEAGMADAFKEFETFKVAEIDSGKRTSADCFGDRTFLDSRYLDRMAGAVLGIYGNSKKQAIYPAYFVDAGGQPLDGKNRYTLHFDRDTLPPVNSFWSLTMYELPSRLLVANPINRHLINSSMLPSVKRDDVGGLTIYIQHDSPGLQAESNWLPAPAGPFFLVMRLYWPKQEALDGQWTSPKLEKAD